MNVRTYPQLWLPLVPGSMNERLVWSFVRSKNQGSLTVCVCVCVRACVCVEVVVIVVSTENGVYVCVCRISKLMRTMNNQNKN
jgi:hypothetical protein